MRPTIFSSLVASAVVLGISLPAQETARSADTFNVPGTDVQVRTWTADGAEKSAFSRNGGRTWIPLPNQDYQLKLRAGTFDPAAGDAHLSPALMAPNDNNLFFVQFKTDIVPEYLTALERMGAEAARYMPEQTYIVRMPRGTVDLVAEQPFVRAVMDVHPAYKLEESIIADVVAGVSTATVERYNIMMVQKQTDEAAVLQQIATAGGVVVDGGKGGVLVIADLDLTQVMTVAGHGSVLWIDKYGEGENDIDVARVQAGVNSVELTMGRDFGQGMRGHIVEGIHTNHTEFNARQPFRGPITGVATPGGGMYSTGSTGHGTNTAGEIYARGASANAKGLLPFAQGYHTAYSGGSNPIINTNNRYPLTQQLQNGSLVYKAMIQTASWGYPRSTTYNTRSAEMDDILFDFPRFYVTNSQSNSGGIPSRPQAWAKNVVGVGGFNHYGTASAGDDCHCNTGSTGPCNDGRVGVTFAAYYDQIRTTSGSTGYSTSFGGTSGATPIVNGLSGAVIEMHTDGLFGYPTAQVVGGVPDRFSIRPNLSMSRVLITMGTRQVDFTGGSNAIRVEQGWGFPNLQDIYDNRNNILVLDEEDVLQTGDRRTYWVWVKPGTEEFRASMHHLEDEANPSANKHRINSLDLSVRAADGSFYWGNGRSILNNQFSSPEVLVGGNPPAPNDTDIHENVFIQGPGAGVYSVSVTATNVRADSHRETKDVDADFSLAIRGIGGGRDTSGVTMDLVSGSAGQFDVNVGNVPAAGWTVGRTLMTTDTARHLSLGNLFGLELDGLTLAILSTPAAAGDLFSFTNTSGQYPYANFQFPAAVAIALQGVSFDAAVVLFDASGNVVEVSNVDRVTVQ